MIRHLVYHCYPLAENDQWRWNLDQLRRRLHLFNGRRIIALALDRDTDTAGTVRDYLAADGIEWIELENNPRISETASWVKLWERIEGEPGCTFRAHAKGVTPYTKEQRVRMGTVVSNHCGKIESYTESEFFWFKRVAPPGRLESMRLWATMLYESLLDHWPLVEQTLERQPIVGVLKHEVANPPDHIACVWPGWHFMGSFYWVRNRDFFARDWRGIQPGFYGVETWPGYHFDTTEAACLFYRIKGRPTPMDYPAYVRLIWRKFEGWKRHQATRGMRNEMVHVLQ